MITERLEQRIVLSATIGTNIDTGTSLRNYRLAIAATAEYTTLMGGQAQALTAIQDFVSQVNEIYEDELAIHFDLVTGTNTIFTDSGTDGYTNGNTNQMLQANTAILDGVIGNSSYDIGHVFGTAVSGGAGLATLGSVGVPAWKGRGASISSNPSGPSWVNLVAHEFGHQFGAEHTFNANAYGSTAGNRSAANAYEPASGSTLMSYAGIADDMSGDDNLQLSPDNYFHSASFDDIQDHVNSVATPFSTTPLGNNVPTINGGADYTIPADTPFFLTATGSDADGGDVLTYTWEQLDLGPAMSLPLSDNGSSPLFRSFPPSEDPTRVFPRLTDLLNNVNTAAIGELLPATNRNLNFRATVRDGNGGVNSDDVLISVVDTGTPFAVTSPNTPVNWAGGTSQTVVWNVAGTDAGAIGVSDVMIDLSLDGGLTYPFQLAGSTPNDGSFTFTVPNIDADLARVRVQSVGNVFFDVSNVDFEITADGGLPGASITETDGNTATSEDGVVNGAGADSFTVALNTTPSSQVEVTFDAGAQLEISTDGVSYSSSLSITKSDTSDTTIWVRGVDDSAREGIHRGTINASVTASADPNYPIGMPINPITASIADDELQPVIGVDFDQAAGQSPENWTRVSQQFGGTTSDLVREDGVATGVDLVLGISGAAGLNPSTPNAVPLHSPSLEHIDGLHLATQSISLTWTGLTPSTDYNVYLFLAEFFSSSVIQEITINGSVYPNPFQQDTSSTGNELLVNSGIANPLKPIEDDALVVQSNSDGQVSIVVLGLDNGLDNDAMLSGAAIQEIGPDAVGFSVQQTGGSTAVAETGSTDTFDVSLYSPPTGDVVIDLQSSDSGEATLSPSTLTFTPTDWNVPQTVTVTGVDDGDNDGSQVATVTLSINAAQTFDVAYDTVADRLLDVVNQDNEALPLIGVDFEGDSAPDIAPPNWNVATDVFGATYTDLTDESGAVTAVDLSVTVSGGANALDTSAPSNLPDHTPSLAEIAGLRFSLDSLLLQWSGLAPGGEYDLWLFAAENYSNTVRQTVTITGGGSAPAPFVMDTTLVGGNTLLINDAVASPARTLDDDAVRATADGSGQIQVLVEVQPGYDFALLNGAAIRAVPASTAPEINVQGGSPATDIADGDVTPRLADGTDFDSVATAAGSTTNTFTIQNLGTAPLNVSQINVSGAHASDFTVSNFSPGNVAVSGSLTFDLTFDPSADGTRTATVAIVNDDSDENPYDFAVTGIGSISIPTLVVEAASGTISEADGAAATTITVTRNSDISGPLDVDLWSDDTSEATLIASATIPAGQPSVTVNVDAVDDSAADGTQSVTVTASGGPGYVSFGPTGLDFDFGIFGKASTQINATWQPPDAVVATLPDGKILAIGEAPADDQLHLVRHNADGSPDASFGSGGLVVATLPVGPGPLDPREPSPTAIVVLPDGRFAVGGVFKDGVETPFLAQFNADGSPDTNFGTNGHADLTSLGLISIENMDRTHDGKLLVALSSNNSTGFRAFRVNPDGLIDLSFGNQGVAEFTDFSAEATDVLALSDGRFLLLGNDFQGGVLARGDSLGNHDTDFGQNGSAIVALGAISTTFSSMLLDDSNRIVIGGTAEENFNRNFVITRFSFDGELDATFDGDGTAIADWDAFEDEYLTSIEMQADGKILAVGYTQPFSGNEAAVARINVDGSIDNTFDGDGWLITTLGNESDQRTLGSGMTPDGSLIVLGGNDSDLDLARINLGVIPYVDSDVISVTDDDSAATLDFGDGPSSAQSGFAGSYPVTVAASGASHLVSPGGPMLGFSVEAEIDGVNSAGATFDDGNGSDDEDGVVFAGTVFASAASTSTGSVFVELQNANPTANRLDAWIDFNRDGDWNDPGEQIFASFDLGTTDGGQWLTYAIPQDGGANVVNGTTYARFRLSSAGGLAPTGGASDGEVEDHEVVLVSADAFVVDTLADESDGDFSPGDFSLREAIELANSRPGSDEITFAPALSGGTITLAIDRLTISDDLTITGPGASNITVSGDDQFRIFRALSGTSVLFDGFTITQGRPSGPNLLFAGAGILTNGDLELRNMVVTDNHTPGDLGQGGGIYSTGSLLTISDSTISDNSTSGTQNLGGGVHTLGTDVVIRRSVVSGNTTTGELSAGAGIVVLNGNLLLEDSTVSGNTTTGTNSAGGGVTVGGGNLIIENSTISENTTTGPGAGIAFDGNGFTADVTNSTISGNATSGSGGGIANFGGTFNLSHSTVTLNTAPSGEGGGLASYASSGGTTVMTNVSSSVIAGNFGGDVEFIFFPGPSVPPTTIVSDGFNLVGNGGAVGDFNQSSDITGVSAQLGPLQNNGGPTATHALLPGSPAIDAGDTTSSLSFDQRGSGFPRLVGSNVDIGAYERALQATLSIAATDAEKPEGDSGDTAFTFTVTRSGDTSGATTADYAVTGSGSDPATADDFGGTLPSGTVSFADGESSQVITVNVSGDTSDEPDEGFTVTLSNASSPAIIAIASDSGLIENDDSVLNQPPVLTLPAPPVTFTEGGPQIIVDPQATISDSDSADFDGGELTVAFVSGSETGDALSIRNEGVSPGQVGVTGSDVTFGGVVVGSFTAGTSTVPLMVTFNADSSPAAAEAILRNVTFENAGMGLAPISRVVEAVVSDGDGGVSADALQNLNFLYAIQIGGTGSGVAEAVDHDGSGNIYVAGYFNGTIDVDPGPATVNLNSASATSDILVASYTPAGDLRWAHQIGVTSTNRAFAIDVTDDGSVYVGGRFGATADFDPGPGEALLTTDGSDGFILRLDPDGNYVDALNVGGNVIDLSVDSIGNIYATGSFFQTQDFDPGPGTLNFTAGANSDSYVLKLDPAGALLWARHFDESSGDSFNFGNSISTDSNGNVYSAGTFNGSIDFDPGPGVYSLSTTANVSDADGYVVKLNSDGLFEWAHHFGSSGSDQIESVLADSENGVYVGGYFRDTVDFDPGASTANRTSDGNWDGFVVKLDQEGDFQWVQKAGGGGTDQVRGLDLDRNGNVYAAVYFNATVDFDPSGEVDERTATGSGHGGTWILGPNGDYIDVVHYGGTEATFTFDLAVDDNGDLISAGQFSGTVDFDPGPGEFNRTALALGTSDPFVHKTGVNLAATQRIEIASSIDFDFGDAPSSILSGFISDYPVTLADDGARHELVGPRLGPNRDSETDGIHSAAADGDDLDGQDDEDGVLIAGPLYVSAANSTLGSVDIDLQNPDPTNNRLDGWVDFNRDGDWDDAGEQIFANADLGTAPGLQTLNFTIPQDTGDNVDTGADAVTYAWNGYLEDTGADPWNVGGDGSLSTFDGTPFSLEISVASDAPDLEAGSRADKATYTPLAVTLDIGGNPATVQSEYLTLADDLLNAYDSLVYSVNVTLNNLSQRLLFQLLLPETTFSLADDTSADLPPLFPPTSPASIQGTSYVENDTMTFPADAPGSGSESSFVGAVETYARFRLSTAGGLAPTGAADDGEVEDYAVLLSSAVPELAIAADAAQLAEGDSGTTPFTFTVTRSGDTTGATSVDYAVTGSGSNPADADDFGGSFPSGTVNFAAGETSQVITVDVSGDTTVEPDDGFTVTLSNPSSPATIATATADATIDNDDTPGFLLTESDGSTLVFEDGSTDTFSIVLLAQPQSDVVIDIASADTGEVSVSLASVTFTNGNWNVPQTVTVTGVDDPVVDGDQTTLVTASINDAASDDAFDPLADQTISVTTRDVDGSIRGTVWNDIDGNQSQNGEPGLAGVTVYLDLNRNGALDSGEPTQVSAGDGSYSFENLAAGEYVVGQIVPSGLAQTYPQILGSAGTFAELINDQSDLSVYATHAPRDASRLFVLEKNSGSIRILDLKTGALLPTPFLTIPDVDASANEAGLLGLAFHPDYANNGKFYVNVTVDNSPSTNFATHIREYTVTADPNVADPNSVREILSYAQPFGNHNGGWIDFSPNDGHLYIASGDGGSGGDPLDSGQSLDTLLGKMLRIDVNGDDFPGDPDANYAIPPSNPFVGTAGAREEIWAWGLRNPWQNSFDPDTGDLWIGDVGQNAREEIDFQSGSSSGGENYAWNRREGFVAYNGGSLLPGDVEPVYDYEHGTGDFQGNSVVGGHVYRGPIGAFYGDYIFADSRSSNVWSFDPADPINTVQRLNDVLIPDAGAIGGGPIPDDIVSFAEDGSGNLYMVQVDGEIHKIGMNLPGTHTVLVDAGEIIEDIDFGNQNSSAGSIGDRVFEDLDADGIQDPGELGIDNVTVNLRDGGTSVLIASTTTASGGLYSFGGLAAGDYIVEFVAPSGFQFSPRDQGGDDSVDSDADRITGRTNVISLAANTDIDSIDGGLFQLADLGGRVWDDLDFDGIQDNGEPGLSGVAVDLVGQHDNFQDGTLQNWTTAPVNPLPPLWVSTGGPDGSGDGFMQMRSDGSAGAGGRLVVRNIQWATDLSGTEAITASVNNQGSVDLNFRIAINGPGGWFASTNAAAQPISAGSGWTDLIFSLDPADLTNVFEAESAGQGGTDLAATLASVSELRILHNDQPNFRADPVNAIAGIDDITHIVDSTVTDGSGVYGFSPQPGTYQVDFSSTANRSFSPADQGGDDTLDSDADPAGRTAPVTLVSGDSDQTIDAGSILNRLTVTIDADSISESAGNAATTAVVSRNTDTTDALTVMLLSSDTTEAAVPFSVIIPAGQSSSAPFAIDAVDDAIIDGTQPVTITAFAPGYLDGTDSVDVTDDDTVATVSVSVSPNSVSEDDSSDLIYTFTRTGDLSSALTVNFATTGTAAAGTDYIASEAGTVTIPAGFSTAEVIVDPIGDSIVETDETVIVTVNAGVGYAVGAPFSATGTIDNDDFSRIDVSVAPDSILEDAAGVLTYTFSRDNTSPESPALTVNFSTTGTATAGADFTQSASGTVTFAAGQSTATMTVDPTVDSIYESNETVILTVTPGADYIVGNTPIAQGTIIDDDSSSQPSVESIVYYNDDADAERDRSPDGSGQRSIIRRIRVVFSGPVSVPLGSVGGDQFILESTSGPDAGTRVGLEVVSSDLINGRQVVVLKFTGKDLIETLSRKRNGERAMLVDGRYRLTVSGAALGIDANGAASGTDSVDEFFRLFGDSDGDGDVDSEDNQRFLEFYSDGDFDSLFDFDDKRNRNRDRTEFLKRLGTYF